MMTMTFKLLPEQTAERMALYAEYFGQSLQNLHNACCFYILEMCLQWTRVDTGRLRSGWIPFLSAHNHNYERSLGPIRKPEDGAIEEGMSAGRFQESYLNLYVENGVDYAGDVDNALRGPNGGIFDMTGEHSYRPAPVGTFVAAVPLFAEQYATRMQVLFKNCDAELNHIMKGGSPEDLETQTDLGPPDMN